MIVLIIVRWHLFSETLLRTPADTSMKQCPASTKNKQCLPAIPQHSSHQQIKPSKFPLGPLGNSILNLYGQGSGALPVHWGRAWCEEYQERGHSRSWKLSQVVFNVSFFSPSGVVLLQWGDAGQAPMLTQKMDEKKQTSANEIHTKWSCDGGRCYVWTLSFFNSSFH